MARRTLGGTTTKYERLSCKPETSGGVLARADLDEGSTEGCAKRGTYEKRCVLDLTMHASIKAAPAECLNACARTAILVNGKEPTNQTINII